MKLRQIALPLDELRPGAKSSLIITDANSAIFAALGDGGAWPSHCALLIGPARSGKSLLARYFELQLHGHVIDDAEIAGEETLFNAWNRAANGGAPLLLISRFAPAKWNIALPDLRSRLASALMFTVPPPDDELISQLLQKHLRDRGTMIGGEALSYVIRRIERSYSAIENFARDTNALAMAENTGISLALVKRILES